MRELWQTEGGGAVSDCKQCNGIGRYRERYGKVIVDCPFCSRIKATVTNYKVYSHDAESLAKYKAELEKALGVKPGRSKLSNVLVDDEPSEDSATASNCKVYGNIPQYLGTIPPRTETILRKELAETSALFAGLIDELRRVTDECEELKAELKRLKGDQ